MQPAPEFEALPISSHRRRNRRRWKRSTCWPAGDHTGPENGEPAVSSLSDELEFAEGLESAADPTQFVIDPEVTEAPSTIEGLISSDTAHQAGEAGLAEPGTGEPGLGAPILDEDPLAGLNILEDDRHYIHQPEDNPLSSLLEKEEANFDLQVEGNERAGTGTRTRAGAGT